MAFGIRRAYPTPIVKPLWPYAVGGVITFFLFAKAANASMNTEEFINDPRNPRFKAGGVKEEH
ncbi:ATPase, F0 complex, subunit J [Yarrowia lipolytica]|uniref:ATP synthase subunit J, mitochondrial n=2 Tax=Yarrowia lipolytica TaxID=4952 RepID=ATP18_YARLI|nr:YALI0D17490p [Yarrowia lipolytica CLIB122]Q6C8S0.2 RecName: Full=ATP synthase subunit J, mitochondrial; AltName: Full=ATPase synthase I subunit [Yarrowia lipolytica CLIB122]KAB8281916.1 ATPase, F0 complex, subunit J [Yarrowia lipolytica]KAE8169080.1 ATPase, F0 complex, subunit J [Yarrowia lipolytica]KAJ8054274.1 ATPase, F0 complex, subunit J [Yarrowia lipolytica]QNP97914.1 ATP-synthetase J [Yarrowia lipolytica]RDW23917.1 ATPase, F0 complex, subunit J [Yarrowia lipolytica]|eukprot:XP_502942.2 YALI0D17490p [Yarrowia lipolytica CLIB122]